MRAPKKDNNFQKRFLRSDWPTEARMREQKFIVFLTLLLYLRPRETGMRSQQNDQKFLRVSSRWKTGCAQNKNIRHSGAPVYLSRAETGTSQLYTYGVGSAVRTCLVCLYGALDIGRRGPPDRRRWCLVIGQAIFPPRTA